MPKFFTAPDKISNTSLVIEGGDVSHITRVLRLGKGDEITVCDGCGYDYRVHITQLNKQSVEADIIEKYPCTAEPSVKITVYQALPKQGKMEYIIQKNTELGVCEFVPVYTKRCVAKPSDKTERWQKAALEAAKQCGRGVVPPVREVIGFDAAVKEMSEFSHKIMLYEEEKQTALRDVLTENVEKIAVLIGPEGGFDPCEAEKAAAAGIPTVTLGSRILRTETAAAAVTPVIMFVTKEI